ncbi:hypothetical protein [Marisediminicola sp. LYQ134]|uniref:hypothetical protein n=1 Tax=Marisediminicola sp. LYQ134 TaxID=3391061 RepID=UPI003982DFE2
MSVLYRAVWSDTTTADRVPVIETLRNCVAVWTQERSDPEPMPEGESHFQVSQGRDRTVSLRSIGSEAFELTAVDIVPGDPTEWVTAIRAVADGTGIHTLVELSMSSDDLARRVSVGRPRIVHELLGVAAKPHLGGSRLVREPLALPSNGISILTDLLADETRRLPIIVCAQPNGENTDAWQRVAATIASRAEGVAVVITLDSSAVTQFRDAFGSLAIWDGGVRIYAPGAVSKDSDGWRHRYYVRSRLEGARHSTVDRIVYSVAQLSTRRRVPDAFAIFGQQSGLPLDALDEMVPASALVEARERWEFDSEVARDEQSSVERELSSANGHLSRLKKVLIDSGQADLLWGTQHEDSASIPDAVQYTSEAAMAAQAYLSEWLVLPDSAIRELEDIDSSPEAYNWGNKTWRGLRALAAYAEDRAAGWDKGGFWEWCASGPLLGWPATTKKLSMTESESVQNNDKLSRTRIFKVDLAVNSSGETTMLAHLKISEGGGSLAPRVYFYDDTSGPTKKVHIGLVGPHYLVPNKSSN